jgi:serine/threonine protein kinase
LAAQQTPSELALAPTQDYGEKSDGQTDRVASDQASKSESASSLIGQRVGQYRIENELGRGGMGIVYSAVHIDIGQRAALKTLHVELSQNPQFKKRFLNGMRAPRWRR